MDSWKKHALVSLENDLKVNLGVTDLVGRLERPAGGFMTELERKLVEEVEGGSERVGRIISILRGKGNKEFDTFLKILNESGNEVWADKIQESAHQFEEDDKPNDQSGLKAIEYPVEGGSDMSIHLSQGSQVQGDEGIVLKRKWSGSSVSSGGTHHCPAEKRTMDEYMKMKMDLERQDMKSVHTNGDQTIRLLYANALSRIIRLLEPHLDAVKDAADTYLQLGLHKKEENVKPCDIQSAESVSKLLNQLSVKAKWGCTTFLQQAVDAIPANARKREVAETILSHYDLHLAIYEKATLLKNDLPKKKESAKGKRKQVAGNSGLVPVEITSSKPLAEFTCEDCHRLQIRFLSQSVGIPAEKIICLDAVESRSTTVTFLIPNGFTYTIMQRSPQLETVWMLLELRIIEVTISGFTFKPSIGCFLTLLRESKPFTADLLRVTEILPYQMHCLVDPGTKEPLSGRPLGTERIAQYREPHEDMRPEDRLLDAGRESVDEQPHPAPSDRNTSPKVKEEGKIKCAGEETEDGGKMLLSRVQKLEHDLKTSEHKRVELIHGNTALQIKAKTSREEESRVRQELASVQARLLSVLTSQVEQHPLPHTPPRARPQSLPPPSESDIEAKVKELSTQLQQIKDENSKLELENSDLQKMLNQQEEKYDHDMEVITQMPTPNPSSDVMLKAVENDDPSMVQLLIKQFVNVEGKDGRTPLLLAAEMGHTDLVRKLAEQYEGDIFHTLKNSRNALHLAAYRGHLPVLQYLCPMFGDRVLDRDGNDETCLDIAHRLGRRIIADFLTKKYPQLEGKAVAGAATKSWKAQKEVRTQLAPSDLLRESPVDLQAQGDSSFFLNVLLLGRTGMGKSTTGNKLLGAYETTQVRREWPAEASAAGQTAQSTQFAAGGGTRTVTRECEILANAMSIPSVRVMDTTGFSPSFASKSVTEANLLIVHDVEAIAKTRKLSFDRVLYFLPERGLPERAGGYLEEELAILWHYFGYSVFKNMVIVVTVPPHWRSVYCDIDAEFGPRAVDCVRRVFLRALEAAIHREDLRLLLPEDDNARPPTSPPPCPYIVFIPFHASSESVLHIILNAQVREPIGVRLGNDKTMPTSTRARTATSTYRCTLS